MQHNQSPTSLVCLENAIDRRPLTVSPDTLLTDVIAMMGKAQSSCILPSLKVPLDSVLMNKARASGVFVVEGTQLVGVFTDRDAVWAIAKGMDLAQVNIASLMRQPSIALAEADDVDVFTALSLLRQHQIRHLPILQGSKFVGVVTFESIRQALQLDELLKSQPLSEAIASPVIQAPLTADALSLAQLMIEHHVNCVVLTKTDPEKGIFPVGIVSERDLIQLYSLKLDLQKTQAHNIIVAPLLCLNPKDSVLVAHWKMQQQYVQCAVVSDSSGELLGIVTTTSFLQTFPLTEMSRAVEQLQQSINQFAGQKALLAQNNNTNLDRQGRESHAELLEQLERNRLLTAIALRIRESLNLDAILNTAVTEVRQFLQTDRVIIYRFNPDLSGTVVVESVAEGWQPALGSTVKDTCFAKDYAQSYKEGRIQVTEDIYTAGLTQCHIDILVLFDIRANLVVPILQKEQLWGLLCAYHCSGPRRWREFEVDLLKQLATQVAIAIQQSTLFEQAQAEIAERKRAEEQLKASLKEKEVLLKEIHHRVKNNLQIISSLLKLQSAYIKEQQAVDMFKDSQNRIRSMALIHEKLYQSKDLSKIDFAEYIRDLTFNLLRSYKTSSQIISLQTTVNDIWLNIDTAIPCGLIINELVSNSLKHAFTTSNRENQISINLNSDEDKKFVLIVSDNGSGFPEKLDFRNTESLGLELVCTLTEQLEGTIELDSSTGTSFKITFSEIGNLGRNN